MPKQCPFHTQDGIDVCTCEKPNEEVKEWWASDFALMTKSDPSLGSAGWNVAPSTVAILLRAIDTRARTAERARCLAVVEEEYKRWNGEKACDTCKKTVANIRERLK